MLVEAKIKPPNYLSTKLSVFLLLFFVLSLFTKVFQAEYGERELDQQGLEEQLKTIVQDADGVAVHSENGELVVAAVTPLMARAHDLPEAGETVFVDASGNMDRANLRVFLLMTWSLAGGIPLGVIITTSESEATISKGLQMLQEVMPKGKKHLYNAPKIELFHINFKEW